MYISTVSFVEYTPAGEQRQRFVIGLGLFHGTERNAGLKHGTHGTKHYKYHVTSHASHVFILVCVWSTPWI